LGTGKLKHAPPMGTCEMAVKARFELSYPRLSVFIRGPICFLFLL
jgi:hypothetical protein